MTIQTVLPAKIKSVESVDKNFKITWLLDDPCNYDCSYCFPKFHTAITKNTKYKTLATMKREWQLLYDQIKPLDKKINISFSGGELTVNKDFLPFIEWLRNNFSEIDFMSLTSNGSASKSYYTKLTKYLTNLTLSTHIEFFNEHKFFNLVTHLHSLNSKILYIQLMNEYYYPNNNLHKYEEFLKEQNVPYTLMNINHPNLGNDIVINTNTKKFKF